MKSTTLLVFVTLAAGCLAVAGSPDHWWPETIETALARSGSNRDELTKALDATPADQRAGMQFLLENMPLPDLRNLSADYLLENTALAYESLVGAPWAKEVPQDVFLEDILPYASLNERRDAWRRRLGEITAPIVHGSGTPGEAAQALNRQLFGLVKVRYSTDRKKPDQSALETMESGIATCSGLSILLVDACRTAGIPARIAGTPMWKNMRGNHTWVEVWDHGWHFLGAGEPDAKGLDHAWFTGDAAQAERDVPEHAIYASTFRKTGLAFPLVWDSEIRWVPAVNVTDRYTGHSSGPEAAPVKTVRFIVRVLDHEGGKRLAAKVTLTDPADASVKLEGISKDETADLNNLLTFSLAPGHAYKLQVSRAGKIIDREITASAGENGEQTVSVSLGE